MASKSTVVVLSAASILGLASAISIRPQVRTVDRLTSNLKSKVLINHKDSESREVKSLDGIWNFRLSDSRDPELGFREGWFKRPLSDSQSPEVIPMPVPSSYNDITQGGRHDA